jgi:hypothetical protein
MSITLVADTVTGGLSSATSSAIDTTGVTLIVLHVSYLDTVTPPTVSDSKGNTWTPLTLTTTTVSGADRFYYCLNPIVGSGHTFSFSGTNTSTALSVAAFAQVASFDLEGPGNVGGPSSSGSAPGPITPSVANALVITGFHWENSGTTASITSPFTIINQIDLSGGHYPGAIAYHIHPATSVNPQWDDGGSGRRTSVIASFKPAVAQAKSRAFLFGPGWFY